MTLLFSLIVVIITGAGVAGGIMQVDTLAIVIALTAINMTLSNIEDWLVSIYRRLP